MYTISWFHRGSLYESFQSVWAGMVEMANLHGTDGWRMLVKINRWLGTAVVLRVARYSSQWETVIVLRATSLIKKKS